MIRVRRLFGLVLLVGVTSATAPASPTPALIPNETDATTTAAIPEVRLRKLHLVRPDLIPYPIAFDVVC